MNVRGPSNAEPFTAGPSTAGPSTARPSMLSGDESESESEIPPDTGTKKQKLLLKRAICNRARKALKIALFNKNMMLHGELLLSELNNILTDSVMELISDKGLAKRWISEHSRSTLKSLRIVPVNLRNEIKCLARAIILGSWGLSPAVEEHIADIPAYRHALVEALTEKYDHVDSNTAPFGHPTIIQMTQAIIRQFRDYIPINHDNINIHNIIAFAMTMLRFALREFSNGTYTPLEFLVEEEDMTYNEVLQRIEQLDGTNLEFHFIVIQHIFKLL